MSHGELANKQARPYSIWVGVWQVTSCVVFHQDISSSHIHLMKCQDSQVRRKKYPAKPNRTYDIADDKNPRINGTSANLGQLQPKRTPKKELEGGVGWNLTYVTYYSVSTRVLDFRSAWDRTGLPDDHMVNLPK